MLEGFGFGAALLAMFMRVGGGIFTKAADVGADLVGKVEQGIPEDDPRNAATIADNVGDNVGDCAGMAADLFESYAVTLVAALILGKAAFGDEGLVFPLLVPAIGALTAVARRLPHRARARRERADGDQPRLLHLRGRRRRGVRASPRSPTCPRTFAEFEQRQTPRSAALQRRPAACIATAAVALGIVLAGVILWLTGYFTGTDKRPTLDVARTSLTGAATVVLSGIGLGLESAVYTAVVIAGAVYLAFLLGGGSLALSLFLIALAGCGLLTTVGVIVAMDTFGPVSDNAQGIAEMSGDVDARGRRDPHRARRRGQHHEGHHQGHRHRHRGARRDGAVRLVQRRRRRAINAVADADRDARRDRARSMATSASRRRPRWSACILGAAVVFLFSGLAIDAVTRAAGAIVFEVRRQFREHPGIMDGTEKPEYGRVVDICTRDSLRELATPGLLAAWPRSPSASASASARSAGYLAGAIAAGVLMAVFLAELRRGVGQREEARRGRPPRRQGLRGPRGHRHRRHRRRPVQGHRRPVDQPAHQGHEPRRRCSSPPRSSRCPSGPTPTRWLRYGIAVVATVVIVAAVVVSKLRRRVGHDRPDRAASTGWTGTGTPGTVGDATAAPPENVERLPRPAASRVGGGLVPREHPQQPTPGTPRRPARRTWPPPGYTVDGRRRPLLGDVGLGGAGPGAGRCPALRATAGAGEPAAVLLRLLDARAARDRAPPWTRRCRGPGRPAPVLLGLVAAAGAAPGDEVRALVDLRPYVRRRRRPAGPRTGGWSATSGSSRPAGRCPPTTSSASAGRR